MHFFIQTTLFHKFRTNIAIIRSRANQNTNNLIKNLTIHLNDRFLMVFFSIIQCCINTINTLTNIPNSVCLLSTIDLQSTTLMFWTISPMMISSTSSTLQGLLNLLLSLKSMSSVRCVEIIRWFWILFITYTLRSEPPLVPFSFVLIISLLVFPSLRFALWFFILIL